MNLPIRGKEKVAKVLPHKGKMVLLDAITGYGDKTITTESILGSGSPAFDEEAGATPSFVCFELMAQSVSAYADITRGGKPKIGFILSVERFKASEALLERDAVVTTCVKQEFELGKMFSFSGVCEAGGRRIAEGLLMLYTVEDPMEVLQRK